MRKAAIQTEVVPDAIATSRPIRGAASYVTTLECSATGECHNPWQLHNLSRAGKPLLVRYDLEAIRAKVPREALQERPWSMWRYRELLPSHAVAQPVSLGECVTPLLSLERLAYRIGAGELLIKLEGQLPTGSFKARGQAVAVSMAKHFGVTAAVIPTAGNAGAAMAAYCTRAGISSHIFCPRDTPKSIVRQSTLQGGHVYLVDGLLDDCASTAGAFARSRGCFEMSTFKEPYRLEGKKTMGFELAEQLGWDLPDVIFYPTGGGTGFVAMWKAFDELQALGWIGGKRPRMVSVQSSGCAPLVKAWREGREQAERWDRVQTFASGLRAPASIGDFLVLRVIRESGGFAATVSDDEIRAARMEAGSAEGLMLCPEGAATLAGYENALRDGQVSRTERVVLFDTASGLKSDLPDAGSPMGPTTRRACGWPGTVPS